MAGARYHSKLGETRDDPGHLGGHRRAGREVQPRWGSLTRRAPTFDDDLTPVGLADEYLADAQRTAQQGWIGSVTSR